MARLQIVCTDQSPRAAGHDSAHITNVRVSGDSRCYTVAGIYVAMDRGASFYTVSPSTRREATVHKFQCSCGYRTLRSSADSVVDNNLDNLPRCNC